MLKLTIILFLVFSSCHAVADSYVVPAEGSTIIKKIQLLKHQAYITITDNHGACDGDPQLPGNERRILIDWSGAFGIPDPYSGTESDIAHNRNLYEAALQAHLYKKRVSFYVMAPCVNGVPAAHVVNIF